MHEGEEMTILMVLFCGFANLVFLLLSGRAGAGGAEELVGPISLQIPPASLIPPLSKGKKGRIKLGEG
jgi:hypothetical protein